MTVSITIEMDPAQREFAERLVRDGAFADVSSVVQAGLEQMMRDDAAGLDDLPPGTMEEIARRLELPRDQWIPLEGDTMFEDLHAMIQSKLDAGK
jgi:antitoxin ParD1/3/4